MAIVEGTNAGFVTVAPTDDPGATAGRISHYVAAVKFTSPAGSNTVTSMGWWCDNATTAADYELGIYSHDAANNKPDQLLASSGPLAKGITAGWKTGAVSFELSAGTVYWLAVQCDDTGAGITNIDYATNAAYKEDWKGSGVETLPSPWGVSGGTVGRILALYALYTTIGTNMKVNIGDAWKNISAIQINIGDVWKDVVKVQINIGDAWKTVFG